VRKKSDKKSEGMGERVRSRGMRLWEAAVNQFGSVTVKMCAPGEEAE
jgi:hypothetical protein